MTATINKNNNKKLNNSSNSITKQNSSTYSHDTIIIVIWSYQLNLTHLNKSSDMRLIVVGPSNMIINECLIDIIYHVSGPITQKDQNFNALFQKVRELCNSLIVASSSTIIHLCAFERQLQREVAQIRADFDLGGLRLKQFEQLTNKKNIRIIGRKGGLPTLRFCSFGLVQRKPDAWVECAKQQVGSYPMFLRPVNAINGNCKHTLCIANNDEELTSWIRCRSEVSNYRVDYMVEECLENGYEFIAMVSSKTGLIGTFSTIDPKRTLYLCVESQKPYGIEYLSVEQTRNIMPGLESFVMQSMKKLFNRQLYSLIFIKGFYKEHNAITLLGISLELRKNSMQTLFREANGGKPWEAFALETFINNPTEAQSFTESNSSSTNSITKLSSSLPNHYAMINYPTTEGFLLHQTNIGTLWRQSHMRIVWRVAEGQELLDSDSIDENILQIYMRNESRDKLLADIFDLISTIDIATDIGSLADKQRLSQLPTTIITDSESVANNCCPHINDFEKYMNNSNGREFLNEKLRWGSGNAPLRRSCTTND